MPNWVTNKLVITGSPQELDRLATQMSKPYTSESYDIVAEKTMPYEMTGAFLLWNIVAPTDLDTYHQRVNPVDTEPTGDKSVSTLMKQFHHKVETEDSWYFWNIRNWGTKWEVNNAQVERETQRLTYYIQTAWSPPSEALNTLAQAYPDLVFTNKYHDEMDCFAGETHWSNGEMFDTDLPITHYLLEEIYGSCNACEWADDEMKKEYRCPF